MKSERPTDKPKRKLRSIVQDRKVFQRIVYSQCWEDPVVAAEGLKLGPDDDLLCLTSAGCNVLALSLSHPKSIIALDFSSAQNALLELKIAAMQTLPWGEYVAFLGARPSKRRVSIYRNQVRPGLRDEVRDYFDRDERLLARGIIHEGRFQNYLRIFRRRMLPLVHSRSTVEGLMTIEDPAERARFYEDTWNSRRWRALFTVFFGKAVMAKLGRDPAFFKYVEKTNIGAEFLERSKRSILDSSPLDNHFLQYALLGRYPDLERGPLYLRESNFETLKETSSKIQIRQGDLESFLSTLEPDSLSALYLSDLFEWVSAEHHEEMLRAIYRVTRDKGRLVYWNLLVPRGRPETLADLIAVHEDEAAALHKRDLAFVYGDFHVESVVKP